MAAVREKPRKRVRYPQGNVQISAGVHASEGEASHNSGETVLEIAIKHEFGLGVPKRSFIRAWYDEQAKQNADLIRRELRQAAKGVRSFDQAMDRVALKMEASIKRRIRDGIPPPNSPQTIQKKGSSTPLVDKGQLRASIRGVAERTQGK